MAISFMLYSGETIFANGEPLVTVKEVLESPFHITVKPHQPSPRRLDVNSIHPIEVIGETVMLKVGEPILMNPDYSVMPTRIYNYDPPYCRLSVRCPKHIHLTTKKTAK